jgi:hypothetical protein
MKKLLLTLALGTALGCTGIRPAGPFAKPPSASGSGKAKERDNDTTPEPVTIPAVKPTPPLNTTGPEDVNPDDPYSAAQKLMNELEADRKTVPNVPKTAEISRYKGGVKQN